MKNFAFYLLIISLAFIFSCDSDIKCIRASSNIVSETWDLKDFNGIIFNNWGDVYLTQGPEYSFKIEGPDNVLDFTTTEIESGILIIGSETCFNGDSDLKIEITAPEIYGINLVGGGKIISIGNLITDKMYIEAYGLGEIDVDIVADTLITSISGQVGLKYEGNVIRHELTSTGLFSLDGYALDTDHTYINISGEGDCYVTAFETLDVVISGNGNIYYQGEPDVQSDISGIGNVIDSN